MSEHPEWSLPPCPFLPDARPEMSYRDLRALGSDRGPAFYLTALIYAQCLWCRGLPARAILPLDRAWGAELKPDDPVLREWPPPYPALAWMLKHRPDHGFLGNPVRHFQHLATRVKGPRREVRSWRAWACFHLAEEILPPQQFPRDELQIERDSLTIPTFDIVLAHLAELGWEGEAELIQSGSGRRSF